MLVKNKKVDGKRIEVHETSHGNRRFWATVDKRALWQRGGRLRVRTFSTADAAWRAALEEVR